MQCLTAAGQQLGWADRHQPTPSQAGSPVLQGELWVGNFRRCWEEPEPHCGWDSRADAQRFSQDGPQEGNELTAEAPTFSLLITAVGSISQ